MDGKVGPRAKVHGFDDPHSDCLVQALDVHGFKDPRRECFQIGWRDRLSCVGCSRALANRYIRDLLD